VFLVQNIQFGSDFFVIEGHFKKNDKIEKIICSLKRGQKKIIKRNKKPYLKHYDHFGLIQTVMISPADQDLISEGAFIRRKFIDSIIGQTDRSFLKSLINHNKVITQRNALLKYFAVNRVYDPETLSIYNQQLIKLSEPIYSSRKKFVKSFIPVFNEIYSNISNNKEQVYIKYSSELTNKSIALILEENLQKDRLVQYTSSGIHKDDLIFSIEDKPVKKFGSQGQQKTFLVALKLAQFIFLKQKTGSSPILLFDDAFDKLDQERVTLIIEMVQKNEFGQIFITDTDEERTLKALSKNKSDYKLFNI